ncbi:response regulator [Phenylobacterium deserti]|uniref:histidine kinase n=1 Tax=Phenylobacterium deserti TaxID=1914756 RepID=A0A328AE50_9CAUL|nr:response regulator [Phenylobacterium deserti]RAK52825.1 hybrid sensor histidine kinase/response regulator [Phenylobacterium deserti]
MTRAQSASASTWTPSQTAEPATSAPPDLSTPITARILIVDDDERNAFAAVQALEELGHELVVARSGEEALRRLLVEEFAVILLDLHMPGMDGYETAALIRTRKRTARTPIVFVTAIFRDEAHVFQAYSAGAVDVVFKPVDPFILKSKVSVLVDLYLKTEEVKRQSAYQQWLLDEHARVKAEKALTERALRRTEARQEAILQSLPIVFTSRSLEPPFAPQFVSEAIEEITGFPAHRFVDEAEFGVGRIHPDDIDAVIDAFAGAAETGRYSCEFRWLCADGQYRVLQDQGVLAPSMDGEPREIFGVILDATDRRMLEEQLTHARKMEAVGQLTGGVAHDFNNLLTVVLGNVDMLARKQEEEARRARRIDAIRQAAERGRDLTRQLLAFSRRQHLSPVTLDVNALIRDFAPLVRQAVGEAVTVELLLADEPCCAHVDPTQLETALLNLAVNARDAMPEGGLLSIQTAREAGDKGEQVVIAVSDTGVGMSPDVRERVFEPFFTTKEVGKGSGLGLSQVYGFVRQSEGEVRLESAPNHGTSFQLRLPASDAPAEDVRPEARQKTIEGGSERILVVEDDATVLSLTVDMLGALGYQVTTATNAAEALDVLNSAAEIDLLFTDVVMPGGVSGVSLARTARELRPGLQILLTSGFVGEGAVIENAEFPLLDKPYETALLAAKLRKLLDGEGGKKRRSGRGSSVAAAE